MLSKIATLVPFETNRFFDHFSVACSRMEVQHPSRLGVLYILVERSAGGFVAIV
jgi:hypothetical protein